MVISLTSSLRTVWKFLKKVAMHKTHSQSIASCNYGYCNMSRARGAMHSCVISRRAAMHIRSGRPPFLV